MRLSLRQTQRLVMTPLLQQAIQLLQLSTLELQEVVQKELLENPLLEEVPPVEGSEAPGDAASPEGADPVAPAPAAEPPSKETSTVDGERSDDLPFDLTAALFDHHEERTPVSTEEREDLPFENLGRTEVLLSDSLTEQLRLATDDPMVLRVGEAIIGNLDEDGYLRAEVAELGELTGATPDVVEKVLGLVQSFDPLGVAARTIQECLLLQLRNPIPCRWRSSSSASTSSSAGATPRSPAR
jgi:RNA polymerase sigma-54 factor